MTDTPDLRYTLAGEGVFVTIQGEGALLGVPMVFVRLAGCSVGCKECDTDYRATKTLTAGGIAEAAELIGGNLEWVWITGGEPTDHDLQPLMTALRHRWKIALVTSGKREVSGPDFISVSPHKTPNELVATGDQINIVPGLNGLRLDDWKDFDPAWFRHRWVTPCEGVTDSLAQCLAWIKERPDWRLGIQAHKAWGLP